MPKVFFDVGANNGDSSIHQAMNDPDVHVYAFEPTPRMADIIRDRTRNLPNYEVIQKAVSNETGRATFFIAGNYDWGCSSLCKFNDELNVTWPGRMDFNVTDTIEVDVIRLDSFVNDRNIQKIDYLHVDVQGKDMEVLQGLGEHIDKVHAGVVEVPTSHNKRLYKDQIYIIDDVVEFLKQNGFNVENIEPNDCYNNEVNVYFKRK